MATLSLPGNSKTVADQILRDIRLAAIDAGVSSPPVHPGSDWDMLAQAVARVCMIGVANIALADDDSDVTTATGDALEAKRVELGLPLVESTGSSGTILVQVTGATTIVSGTELTLPNGLRIKTVGTYSYASATVDAEIDVAAIDTGVATNYPADTEVTFVSPPPNVESAAKVSTGSPLTGGLDAEDDERKRKRILNAIAYRPAGGNWAHVREIALNALGTVQDCFVYPALGGPASARIVITKKFDRDNNDFSRAPTTSACNTVRAAIQAQLPTLQDIYVQSPVDESADVALQVTLPNSVLAGGNGTGWLDGAQWPLLDAADNGRVTVTSSSGTTLVVTANTATAPVDLQTHIAWWSPADQKFYTALVVSSSGAAGAWTLTLEKPLVDSTGTVPALNDWICPAARNIVEYGKTWLDIIEGLGPAENTTDGSRTPRANRRPFTSDESPSDITADIYVEFTRKHIEMSSVATSYTLLTTPTVPAAVTTAPSIFVPRRFGIYKAT